MRTKLQLFPVSKLFVSVIACALLLSACGGGSSSSTGTTTGVATPTKVSVANTK
jgi:ABC-type glycerol-3-phosphate transport system substrate-binding protein